MTNKTVYPNKIRLLILPQKETLATTVFFLFGVGSRYEKKEINGLSHFIEHMMFKGTKKRPKTVDLSRELDRVGAEFNAMTSKDYTGYYVKINHDKISLAVDILSDMLLNSVFKNEELNRERGVIIEEIHMYHDNPLMHIESLLEEIIYENHPLGADIAGPEEVIKKVSRQQMLNYLSEYYRPDNLVIVVAGRDAEKAKKYLEKDFIKKFQRPPLSLDSKFIEFHSEQKAPRVKLNYKETQQVQMAIGFPAFGYHDKRAYAMHLLSIILGGNMSSRLFISVRERQGLCYFIRAYPNFYQDAGNFFIQSGLDISRFDLALEVIQKELKKIAKSGVSTKELKDAKEFIRGKIVLNMEDSSNVAEFFGKQELLVGESLTPEQKIKKYFAISSEEVQSVARFLFKKEKFNLAAIGPFKDEEKIYRQIIL
ncbi:MAG: pitrilysin family protein [Patescibacteria group bacterium]